jgi:hypothetical protein
MVVLRRCASGRGVIVRRFVGMGVAVDCGRSFLRLLVDLGLLDDRDYLQVLHAGEQQAGNDAGCGGGAHDAVKNTGRRTRARLRPA